MGVRGRAGGTCGMGHVEERAFRPGEGDEQRRAHHKLKPLRGEHPCVQPCVCEVGVWAPTLWAPRRRSIGLLFCRWCVGRRAYDAEGLALEALRVPRPTVPRGPRQSCQAHDEHRDERPDHELNKEVKSSEALHCAREHAPGAQSRWAEHA